MTKEELKSCRMAAIARNRVIERIKNLKKSVGCVGGIRYDNEPRSRGEPLSKQQQYVEALEQLAEEYEETTIPWARQAAAVERAIRSLPPDLGELIRLRYMEGLRWEEVNENMGAMFRKDAISERTSKRMHREALTRLQNI